MALINGCKNFMGKNGQSMVVFDGKKNTKNLILVRKWSIPGGDFVFI
jgi:hypothetical protein